MDHLETEARNPASTRLDEMTALELVRLMNAEDDRIPAVVAGQAEAIARAIEVIAARLREGGRLIYLGAGTSGRLGVLDAAECPPTFSTPPGLVLGLIAGGTAALTLAVEGAEDHPELAEKDLADVSLGPGDVVVGIATSGRTPYVLGGMAYARRLHAFTIGLSCSSAAELTGAVDLAIVPVVGPEVLSGSTRLKAATATKLILNMLTTGAMVLLGKTYGNLMVDLKATNSKLRARTNRIIRLLTGLSVEKAGAVLDRSGGELKTALVVQLAGLTPAQARERLQEVGGQVRRALETASPTASALPNLGTAADLVLGIDGGGSHTVALLARAPDGSVLARGEAGPSNRHTVGSERALQALDDAVRAAFVAAGLPRGTVKAACLGLAGAGREEDREIIRAWARRIGLAGAVRVMTDADLLLAAGTPEGWGVAVVSGTGSITWARSSEGKSSRAGGWGPLLGDEGSGYALAVAGLRAVAQAEDGRTGPTILRERLLSRMGLRRPQDLIPALSGGPLDRPALSVLAPVVLAAAEEGDAVAMAIRQQGARLLAQTVAAAVRAQGWQKTPFPLAVAGSTLVAGDAYRQFLLDEVKALHLSPHPVCLVCDPAQGALRIALGLASPAV
jgi:N-acetylmuramic acid 6-phosphate etherase